MLFIVVDELDMAPCPGQEHDVLALSIEWEVLDIDCAAAVCFQPVQWNIALIGTQAAAAGFGINWVGPGSDIAAAKFKSRRAWPAGQSKCRMKSNRKIDTNAWMHGEADINGRASRPCTDGSFEFRYWMIGRVVDHGVDRGPIGRSQYPGVV